MLAALHPTTDGTGPVRYGKRPSPVERHAWLLWLAALVLIGFAWSRTDGYRVADSVEYMERARALVHGETVVDSVAIRSCGYTALLAPVFALARIVGPDERWTVPALRLVQMALALALIGRTVRLAACFVSRTSACAAGALLLASPTFLDWSVAPVADVAAALCLTAALEGLFETSSRRRALRTGLWLGAACLVAYKAIALALPIAAVFAWRERGRRQGRIVALGLGLVACALVQGLWDLVLHGTFGLSAWIWVQENAIQQLAHRSHQLGELTGLAAPKELAQFLYNRFANVPAGQVLSDYQARAAMDAELIWDRMDPWWYLREIRSAWTVPALGLVALGCAQVVARPRWGPLVLLALVVLDVLALSNKGAKSFRLWLPFLPCIAVLGAIGFERVTAAGCLRARGALGWIVLIAGVALAARSLAGRNTSRFAGFWDAVDVVEEIAAGTSGPPLRLGCAYHWAVFLRPSARVELVKLPHQLDRWPRLSAAERAADRAALATLDVFVVHLPLLLQNVDLLATLNERFEVQTVVYEPETQTEIGPLFVLRRRTHEPDAFVFWEADVELDAPVTGLDPGLTFKKRRADGSWQELRLLGVECRPLADSGFAWLSLDWLGGPFGGEDYTVVARLVDESGRVRQHEHRPAYGARPTTRWEARRRLRESYLLLPPAGSGPPHERVTASWTLWLEVVGLDDSTPPLEVTRLVPYPVGGALAIEELTTPGGPATADGHAVDAGLAARVARFRPWGEPPVVAEARPR